MGKKKKSKKRLDGVLFKRELMLPNKGRIDFNIIGTLFEPPSRKAMKHLKKRLLSGQALSFDLGRDCILFQEYLIKKLKVDYLAISVYGNRYIWIDKQNNQQ